MGVIKQGILGAVSGKVGSVVGSSWKGVAIVKSMPASVSNPKTALQVAQRNKMTNCVAFAQSILSVIIKPLNDRFAQKMSGYNMFVARNVALFENENPSQPSELVISSGKMVKQNPVSAVLVNGTKALTVNYGTQLLDNYATDLDEVYVVANNISSGEVIAQGAEAVRADGSTTLSFQANVSTGQLVDIWLAFRRPDGTVVSDNGYLRKAVTAS